MFTIENNSTVQGWAEKYRPQSLSEIVGQERLVKELVKRLNSKEGLRQNILLTGNTGTGKSTIAKIIAQTLNCEKPETEIDPDTKLTFKVPCQKCSSCKTIRNDESSGSFHFFDGSDLNKEKILELKHLCNSPNLYSNKKRIIYIDELQAVSGGKSTSLEAFLKLIEKVYPNNSVYFIMSSMNPKKLPKAVIDRFHMHLRLKPVSSADLIARASVILKEEGLLEKVDFNNLEQGQGFIYDFLREGLSNLASSFDGSVREFIQALETCVYRELGTAKEIEEELELMSVDSSSDILVMLIEKSPKFFEAISSVKSELDSFFNLSYNTLMDYFCFNASGEAKLNWQREKYKIWKSKYHANIVQLVKVYNKIFESSVYYKKSYLVNKLVVDYFESTPVIENVESTIITDPVFVPTSSKPRVRTRQR